MSGLTQFQKKLLRLMVQGDSEALATFLEGEEGDVNFEVRWRQFPHRSMPEDGFDSVSPLGAASYWGDVEIMKVLIQYGADPNGYQGDLIQGSPLYNAVAVSNKHGVQLLLDHPDIEVDTTYYANLTPFLLACSKGDFTLISMLLRAGALINERTDAGESAIEMLVSGQVEESEELDIIALVQYLVDAGAPLDWTSENEDIIEMAADSKYPRLEAYLQSIAR